MARSDLTIKVNARLPAVCWNSGPGNANSLASTFKGHCARKNKDHAPLMEMSLVITAVSGEEGRGTPGAFISSHRECGDSPRIFGSLSCGLASPPLLVSPHVVRVLGDGGSGSH